jgi:YD repeat-containing protein
MSPYPRPQMCAALLCQRPSLSSHYQNSSCLRSIYAGYRPISLSSTPHFTRQPIGQLALSTQRVINSLNRLEAIKGGTNPAQQTTAFQYDANGNPVRSTDPLGAATQTTLDALRRPITTQLPDGNQADSYYNQLNQLTAAIDPKGVQTSYVRNAWGEVLSESSPDIGQTSYTRDAVGNVLTMQDAKGQLTSYQYDNLSRVTGITFADGKQQAFFYASTSSAQASGDQLGFLREMNLSPKCGHQRKW